MIRIISLCFVVLLASTHVVNADIVIGGTTLTGLFAADDFNSGSLAGNTRRTSGAGFYSTSARVDGDNLWHDGSADGGRLDFYVGSGFAASVGLNADDVLEEDRGGLAVPGLTTTIVGLTSGTHDVYVAYLAVPGGTPFSNGGILAGLSGGGLTSFGDTNGDDHAGGAGPFDLYIAKLGTTAANSTSFSVDIAERTDTGVTQSLYVGVGYITSVPEPSSLLLFGLGSMVIFCRRRKQ